MKKRFSTNMMIHPFQISQTQTRYKLCWRVFRHWWGWRSGQRIPQTSHRLNPWFSDRKFTSFILWDLGDGWEFVKTIETPWKHPHERGGKTLKQTFCRLIRSLDHLKPTSSLLMWKNYLSGKQKTDFWRDSFSEPCFRSFSSAFMLLTP